MKTFFAIIVALTKDSKVIGKCNDLPWNIPNDLKYFRAITTSGLSNAVIMGRKTWESLPIKPLKNRINIVITSDQHLKVPKDVLLFSNLSSALETLQDCNQVFVIGGQQLYKEAILHPCCEKLYVTEILNENIDGDRFFPQYEREFIETSSSEVFEQNGYYYKNVVFERKNQTHT